MKDTIYRQDAIDAINHICPVDTEYDCTLLDRVDVRCVLSDLPSAQPKQRWIPVSERLPKELTTVLITDKDGDVFLATFIEVINGCAEWTTDDIIAWMPLPEPYKEGEG